MGCYVVIQSLDGYSFFIQTVMLFCMNKDNNQINMKFKEGMMDEAIEALKGSVENIRTSEPGCLAYIPHTVKGKKNKNKIIFYEKYESKEALDFHSGNLPKNMAKVFPFLEPTGTEILTCKEII